MELVNQKKIIIESEGDIDDVTDMSIDTESIGLLMQFLSKNIYSDAVGSTVREWVSNAWDATVKVEEKKPIIVSLVKTESYKWQFTVEDFALGLDDQDVKNIISKYLCSTKRNDSKQLGAMGIGFKAGLAHKPYFQFRCRKNGVERLYMMREGEDVNQIELLYEKETTEGNGVKMILDVDSAYSFSQKIREQLSYFSNVYIVDNYSTFDNNFKIYENELFKWSECQSDKKLHIALGEVYYPLDFQKLGIEEIYLPVAIKIALTDGVIPTINRENLMYTPDTKTLILKKIEEVANWFVNKYNSESVEVKGFINNLSLINTPEKKIVLSEKQFKINDIVKYSTIPISNLNIAGYNSKHLSHLKSCFDSVFHRYETMGVINSSVYKSGEFYRFDANYISFSYYNRKYILVDSTPRGHFLEYLKKEEAGYGQAYLLKKRRERKLWEKTPHGISKGYLTQKLDYYHVLQLDKIPRSEWREYIQEYQKIEKEFEEKIGYKNYVGFTVPEEWIKENKPRVIKEKKLKEEGEIIIHYSRTKMYDTLEYTFERSVVKLEDLSKIHNRVVYFLTTEKEKALKFAQTGLFKTALISKKDLKIIEKHHQFVKMENYKVIRKIASYKLISSLLKQYEATLSKIDKIEFDYFSFIVARVKEDITELKRYIKDNRSFNYTSDDILKEISIIAKENNYYDFSIHHKYLKVKSQIDTFSFLENISVPESKCYSETDEEFENRIDKFKRFINEILLYKKLYKGEFDNLEICVKSPEENLNSSIENNSHELDASQIKEIEYAEAEEDI